MVSSNDQRDGDSEYLKLNGWICTKLWNYRNAVILVKIRSKPKRTIFHLSCRLVGKL